MHSQTKRSHFRLSAGMSVRAAGSSLCIFNHFLSGADGQYSFIKVFMLTNLCQRIMRAVSHLNSDLYKNRHLQNRAFVLTSVFSDHNQRPMF